VPSPQPLKKAPPRNLLVIGRVAAPFGVKGWVKITPFTASPTALARYRRLWVGRQGEWHEVAVEEATLHGASVVARLGGCVDRDAAARLKGAELAVARAALPAAAPGEFYWADLVGLDVVNTSGEPLGKVQGLFSTGANDVMRIGEGKGERLLPFVAAVVRKVDLAARRIEVEWGLDW
jgi:16S rRNA processing protein RimM